MEPTTQTKELTFGQKAVGLDFNMAQGITHDAVHECKQGFADLIDQMNDLRNCESSSAGKKRHASTAITMLEDAQMRAVKALTWKGE